MKYLRRYSTLNDYITDFLDLKSLPAYVSLVDDTDSMIGKDSQKKTVFVKSTGSAAWVGDVLCWNKSTKDWEVVHVKHTYTDSEGVVHDYTKFDSWDDNLVPDGVCVIPACHTDNGKARWISLKQSDNTYMYQSTDTLCDDLTCYTLLPMTDANVSDDNSEKLYILDHNKFSENYTATFKWARIMCEVGFNTDYENSLNNNTFQTSSNGYDVMPGQLKDPIEGNILSIKLWAPGTNPGTVILYDYTEDGSLLLKNTLMFKYKNDNDELNPICDIDGKTNTDIMIINDINNFPAAKACIEYYTDYSNDWYLPAIGELCYLLSRWYTIQQTLYMLKNTNFNWIDTLIINNNYWASTLYSAGQAFGIGIGNGRVDGGGANKHYSDYHIRAMRQY